MTKRTRQTATKEERIKQIHSILSNNPQLNRKQVSQEMRENYGVIIRSDVLKEAFETFDPYTDEEDEGQVITVYEPGNSDQALTDTDHYLREVHTEEVLACMEQVASLVDGMGAQAADPFQAAIRFLDLVEQHKAGVVRRVLAVLSKVRESR